MKKRAWTVSVRGDLRGTYTSLKDANLIYTLAVVCEGTAEVHPSRLWFWQRGGLHVKPIGGWS